MIVNKPKQHHQETDHTIIIRILLIHLLPDVSALLEVSGSSTHALDQHPCIFIKS